MASTLLLADGNPTIQRIVAMTFAGQEFRVVTVNDGDAAIAAIAAERPDIVLADVAMSRRNGYEVAAFVKQRPGLAHIPVVLLTGALEPVDEARAIEAKCDGVLVKPFDPQHVIARVRELVRGGKGHPTQQAPPHVAADDPLGAYFDQLDVAFGAVEAPSPSSLAGEARDDDTERLDLPTLNSVLRQFGRDSAPVSALRKNPFEALIAADRQARDEEKARDEAAAAAPAMNDALIEAVAARVLEKLAPGGVTDLVSRVVADVAERLVRDEIERIRGRK
jgi:CheY-like chemotaxis protein